MASPRFPNEGTEVPEEFNDTSKITQQGWGRAWAQKHICQRQPQSPNLQPASPAGLTSETCSSRPRRHAAGQRASVLEPLLAVVQPLGLPASLALSGPRFPLLCSRGRGAPARCPRWKPGGGTGERRELPEGHPGSWGLLCHNWRCWLPPTLHCGKPFLPPDRSHHSISHPASLASPGGGPFCRQTPRPANPGAWWVRAPIPQGACT